MGVLDKKGILSFFKLNKDVKNSYEQIKEEFEEHLQSINENTNEIQTNYEYICELDKKISKLNEKIDDVSLMLKKVLSLNSSSADDKGDFLIQPLSVQERKVFLTLYTSENAINYKEIAESTNFTESLVSQYITNLIEKGIPLIKHYRLGKAFIAMDGQFKEIQAKRKLVIID